MLDRRVPLLLLLLLWSYSVPSSLSMTQSQGCYESIVLSLLFVVHLVAWFWLVKACFVLPSMHCKFLFDV
jgi:hypothetical protein